MEPSFEQEIFQNDLFINMPCIVLWGLFNSCCEWLYTGSCTLAHLATHMLAIFYHFSDYGVLAKIVGVIGDDSSQF
jgi:hypothetical protein